ncbi:lysophospholipid acyltransferase family protein [bacterium]|nr:lysophospholipid acyltransferase family protein [bacterium]
MRISLKKAKHLLEYGLFRAAKTLIRVMPFGMMMKMAEAIGGRVLYRFGVRRGVSLANLRYAFGDQYSDSELEVLSRGVCSHLFKMAVELINIKLITRRMDEFVEFKNLELFHRALKEGRGAILVTGHFGNFELGALALAWAGLPVSVVAKPLRNRFIDREVNRMRQSLGAEIIPVDDAGRGILSAIRRNRIVCFLCDQDVGQFRGTIAGFFGHPASTPTGPARMAFTTRAPVFPCFIHRQDNNTHVLEIGEAIEMEYSRPMKQVEIQRVTQEISIALERHVSLHPEQYFWLHRRWKSTPDAQWLYPRKKIKK